MYEVLENVATDRSWIPANCLTFAEQSLYLAEAAEEAFGQLFESVGINELAVYESTGMEIVYEGEKMDNFKSAVTKFFQNLWGKIKGAYERILDFFEKKRKESVQKLVKLTSADVDKIPSDAKLGKCHNFNIDGSQANTYRGNVSGFMSKISDLKDVKDAEEIKNKKDEIQKTIAKSVFGATEGDKATDIAKKVKKDFLGGDPVDVTKDWVSKNLTTMQGVVLAGNSKKDIKAAYNAEKKNIDDAIKNLKKLKDEDMQSAKAQITLYKDLVTSFHTAMNTLMDACKVRYGEYRNVLVKVMRYAKKGKTEATSESTVMESSARQFDLVSSVFDW